MMHRPVGPDAQANIYALRTGDLSGALPEVWLETERNNRVPGVLSARSRGSDGATAKKPRVLVVDDDGQLTELLRVVLDGEGYEVTVVADLVSGRQIALGGDVDLVVLDVALGDNDGRVLLSEIQSARDIPVILISGRGDTAERVLGLRMGADDFLGKPFSPLELLARVASVLRRTYNVSTSPRDRPEAPPTAGLRIVALTREVFVDGEPVRLRAKEFDLLAFLARSPRQVFSRRQLLEQVWDSRSEWQGEATVTEHVRRVRRKIERDPAHPRWLTTVNRVGYRLEP